MGKNDQVLITELAPEIFRSIRKAYLKEDELLESFKPSNNFLGIHNFDTG